MEYRHLVALTIVYGLISLSYATRDAQSGYTPWQYFFAGMLTWLLVSALTIGTAELVHIGAGALIPTWNEGGTHP